MIKTDIKLTDFVVLDIENPNTKADSICSIAFIVVKDGKIVDKKYFLINPEDRFDSINMRVNKITPEMVKDAITFDVFWKKYKELLTNNIIVGHAIKYDLSVIYKSLLKYNISLPTLKIVCTQKLSQKYLDINHYKLNEVCNYLGIKLERHHDALCDTFASYEILNYIINGYILEENDIEIYSSSNIKNSSNNSIKIVYSDETKSLQSLKKIVETLMEDNKIDLSEINQLNEWLDSNGNLIGNYPFDKINSIIKNVLCDGKISDEEYVILIGIFNEFINPLKNKSFNCNIIFQDNIFCLTGTFNSGTKEEIESKIISKGGICVKNVSSKTNYLIVGGSGSEAWKFGNYGGKVQKAMELKEKGNNLNIIGEEAFIDNLKN